MKKMLILVTALCGLFNEASAQKGTISAYEREFLQNHMEAATEQLKELVQSVNENEWTMKPADGGWSVAECFEHIVMAMPQQVIQLQTVMAKDAEELKDLRKNDGKVFTKISDRGRKFPTPLAPKQGDMSKEKLWESYDAAMRDFLEILDDRDAAFRTHFGRTPFGEADAYQIMILVPGHVMRHVNQMDEVLTELRS